MYKAYVFDFDYTLANSEKASSCASSSSSKPKAMTVSPEEAIRRTIGMTHVTTPWAQT